IFVYDNSGTLTLEILTWATTATRLTALDLQDGVLCKHNALTRRYVGTICGSGVNVTEDSVANRYIWNYYNRHLRRLQRNETAASSTQNPTSTRAANSNSSNVVNFVIGVSEDE